MNGLDPVALRRRFRAERRAVVGDRRRSMEHRVGTTLAGLTELRGGGRLATYLPADGELDPNTSLEQLRSQGWDPHLPVIGPDRSMRFVPWEKGADLVPNPYGIPEPGPGVEPARGAEELDVVLVPCVAADLSGNRLGFGAGYYDRALASVAEDTRPTLVGIVFDGAVREALPAQPWDVPVHLLVTESRVVRTSRDRRCR